MRCVLHRAWTTAGFLFRGHVFLWDNSVKQCRCFQRCIFKPVAASGMDCEPDKWVSCFLMVMFYCHLVFDRRPMRALTHVCVAAVRWRSLDSLLEKYQSETKRFFFSVTKKSSVRQQARFPPLKFCCCKTSHSFIISSGSRLLSANYSIKMLLCVFFFFYTLNLLASLCVNRVWGCFISWGFSAMSSA